MSSRVFPLDSRENLVDELNAALDNTSMRQKHEEIYDGSATFDVLEKSHRNAPTNSSFATEVTQMSDIHDDETWKVLPFCPDLLMSRLESTTLGRAESVTFNGVCMLADISGFTALSGDLCAKGVSGLDELHGTTSVFLGAVVETVYAFGGDVLSFAGDALICIFENRGKCVSSRAIRCALEIAKFCTDRLTMHIALTCGTMTFAMVGGYMDEWVYMINGEPLANLHTCIDEARAFEVVVSGMCYKRSQPTAVGADADSCFPWGGELSGVAGGTVVQWPAETPEGAPTTALAVELPDGHYRLTSASKLGPESSPESGAPASLRTGIGMNSAISEGNLNALRDGLRSARWTEATLEKARMFTPRPILAAISSGSLDRIAELRMVTTLFLSLDSYSPTIHQDAVTLQPFFLMAQEVLHASGGFMRQFLVDDKGCVLIALWGVPQFTHSNNALRALYAGSTIQRKAAAMNHVCSIGVTTGKVYCGIIGLDSVRTDYVGIGDRVNLAARLMSKAKGRMLVDPATFQLTPITVARDYFEEGEELTLKGLSAPLSPYVFITEGMAPLLPSWGDNKGGGRGAVLRREVAVAIKSQIDELIGKNDPDVRHRTLQERSTSSSASKSRSTSRFGSKSKPAKESLRSEESASRTRTSASLTGLVSSSIRSPQRFGSMDEADEQPGLVTTSIVVGTAGTGKSNVVRYFQSITRVEGVHFLSVQARAGDESVPFSLVRKLLAAVVANTEHESAMHSYESLAQLVHEVVNSDKNCRSFHDALRSMTLLLGVKEPDTIETVDENSDGFPSNGVLPRGTSAKIVRAVSGRFGGGGSIRLGSGGSVRLGGASMKATKPSLGRERTRREVGDTTILYILRYFLRKRTTAIALENMQHCDELSWREVRIICESTSLRLALLLTLRMDTHYIESVKAKRSERTESQPATGDAHKAAKLHEVSKTGSIRTYRSTISNSSSSDDGERDDSIHGPASVSVGSQNFEKNSFPQAAVPVSNSTPGRSMMSPRNRSVLTKAALDIVTDPKHVLLDLKQLTIEDTEELLRKGMRVSEVPKDLTNLVFQVSSGNDFWVRSIASSILDTGVETFMRDMNSVFDAGSDSHPLKILILCRMERFKLESQVTIKLASIIGEVFNVTCLMDILPEKLQPELSSLLQGLVDHGFLMRLDDEAYAFQNNLIHLTVYALSPPSEAARVHAKIAQHYEKRFAEDLHAYYAILSQHFSESAPHRTQAIKYTIKAADEYISRGAFNEGLTFAKKALQLAQYSLSELEVLEEVVSQAIDDQEKSSGSSLRFPSVRSLRRLSLFITGFDTTQMYSTIQAYRQLHNEISDAMKELEERIGNQRGTLTWQASYVAQKSRKTSNAGLDQLTNGDVKKAFCTIL